MILYSTMLIQFQTKYIANELHNVAAIIKQLHGATIRFDKEDLCIYKAKHLKY